MLHTADAIIIVVYLAIMIVIGISARGRQDDASDHFAGGFSKWIGTVLVGLSIAASFFSGISFLVYPSVIYGQGTGILLGLILMPICWFVVGYWFLPRYLPVAGGQPYAVIERRFGYPTRAVAAVLFVMLRGAWMGTLIYAPTTAIIAAFRLSPSWFWPMVLSVGLSSTLYTTLGGIRGVILTDAIQFMVVALGILWPIAHVWSHLHVPTAQIWMFLKSTGRLQPIDLSPSLHRPFTLWSVLIGYSAANFGMYLADQISLQRYLASENIPAARRAFAINAVGVVIVVLLLSTAGLAMLAWYGLSPGAAPAARADDVFPRFVATELPAGAAGLVFAAILAATMSSMTSGINSLAGTLTLDFAARSQRFADRRVQLRFGRCASFVIGLAATGVAGVVSHLGSIFEIEKKLSGAFLGPLLGCMLLSLMRTPVTARGMVAGLITGSLTGFCLIASGVYALWVAPAAGVTSLVIPLAMAVLLPGRAHVPTHRGAATLRN